MRRGPALLILVSTLSAALLAATSTIAYSDGIAGASGAIPERARHCGVASPGPEDVCRVTPPDCGTCHGSIDDMRRQEGSAFAPADRTVATLAINGVKDSWEYTPGSSYILDITVSDALGKRAPGPYAAGAFALNASAGRLTLFSADEKFVRITGGIYTHNGSKNPNAVAPNGKRIMQDVKDDETGWAGEATQTSAGSDRRAWRLRWVGPEAGTPSVRGVALILTVMLPNGDGISDCTHEDCNQLKDFAPQATWDWYTRLTPRRILCEAGAYPDKAACTQAVLAAVLPPSASPARRDASSAAHHGLPAIGAGFAILAIAAAFRRR